MVGPFWHICKQMPTFPLTASPYGWLLNKMKPTPENFSPLVRVGEASRLLGTCPTTIRRMVAAGLLRSVRYGAKGAHRIPMSEILRLGSLKEQK